VSASRTINYFSVKSAWPLTHARLFALVVVFLATGLGGCAPSVVRSVDAVLGPVISDPDIPHAVHCAAHLVMNDEAFCGATTVRESGASPVNLDDRANWERLYEVNMEGNRRFVFDPDISWEPVRRGDNLFGSCSVYARWKYNRLMSLGWPAESIWIAEAAVGSTARNHAFVLVRGAVRGVTGLYVLTNGVDEPTPINLISKVTGSVWNRMIQYPHGPAFTAQEFTFAGEL